MWPRALEKFWARVKNGKTPFPGARGPKIEEKKLPRYPGWLSATFYILSFDRGGKSQNTGFSGPFGLGQPLGTWRYSGPKTAKRNFPELGALFGGKSVRPKSFSQKVRNLFTVSVLADRTPKGGKSQNTGFVLSGRPPQ